MSIGDFPALVPGGDGLGDWPAPPDALRRRMAEVYSVSEDRVLPTRGATHALELVLRAAARDAAKTVSGKMAHLDRLADLCGLRRVEVGGDVEVGGAPDSTARLRVIDESAIEFNDRPSATARLAEGLVVLRSLSLAYGLAGARCGAAIALPATLARLAAVMEPHALPASTIRLAELALSPSRAMAAEGRVRLIREERRRVAEAIGGMAEDGPSVRLPAARLSADRLARFDVRAEPVGADLRLSIGPPEANDRILAALGVVPADRGRRRGEAFRDTKETRIVVTVDLDRAGEVRVRTGVGFFDHMLEQVAAHGGFSLTLACEGDLHTDPHHTVEDSALTLGAALKQALGDRAGIGRYGFVLPMDEAEAAVSLDLSGRPYSVFEGDFGIERIGEYPTALTAHVFRSLADSLGAAIHVRVTGQDDHHKTEACFKALGRALRQAVRLEGGVIPSTKGVL